MSPNFSIKSYLENVGKVFSWSTNQNKLTIFAIFVFLPILKSCQFLSFGKKKVSNLIFSAKKNAKNHKLTKIKMKSSKKKPKRIVVSRSFSSVELRVVLFLTGNRNFFAAKSAVLKNYFRFRKLTASAQPQKVTTPN